MPELKVLLIDDEEELVTTLQERMELRDIAADYVLDGRKAAKKIEERDYDVVILDIMMPGVNGLDVLREIKSARSGLPVILLTGRGNVEDSELGLKLGAYDYLFKPVNIDVLIETMRRSVESEK